MNAVEAKQWRVTKIMNTHGHADHTGANAKIKDKTGAPIMIMKKDAELMTHPEMKGMAGYLGLSESPPADELLEDGGVVSLCPCARLTVIATPGHTTGGASFLCDNALFSGDTLFKMSIGRTDLPGGNHETIINSIRTRLFCLPDQTIVYPGHGEPTTIAYEKENNPFVACAFK